MRRGPLSGHHLNLNSIHRTKKWILGQRQWFVVVKMLLVRESYSLNTSIGLCFSVLNRSDETSLTPSSCCTVWEHNRLKHHHTTASGCSHAIYIYMHAAGHSQPRCLRSQRIYNSLRTCTKTMCRETARRDGVSRGYDRQVLPISCGWWWWASPGL